MTQSCAWKIFDDYSLIGLFEKLSNELKDQPNLNILDVHIDFNGDYGSWEATIYYSGTWR